MKETDSPDHPSRPRWTRSPAVRVALPIAIGIGAFLIDLGTPDNVADGFLYTLAVLACVWVPRAEASLYVAAGLMCPMAVAFALAPSAAPLWEGILDRSLGATAIWLAAVVVWRNVRLMQERERSLAQLRELHGSAERAATAERIALSRWLHEGLAQEMAAVGWGLDRIGQRADDAAAVRADARELRQSIDRALGTVRGKAVALRDAEPPPGTALAALIERYVTGFAGRTGLAVSIAGAKAANALTNGRAAVCFKIVQEALTNVAKHACASRVRVEFREAARVVHLTVTDDGTGLNADARLKPESLGLLGLHERLSAIGGALSLANVSPHGARLAVRIPLG